MSDIVERLNAALEGRYRIESELGEGGMATVHPADDLTEIRLEFCSKLGEPPMPFWSETVRQVVVE